MPVFDQDSVLVDCEGAVASITVNRPKSLNALNIDVLQGILLALEKIALHDQVRVVVVSGAGEKAFVAGADIHSMMQLGKRAIADYVELGQRAMRAIEESPWPVVAKVNGYALGGGFELALACDIIVASEKAKFGQPEVNLGIIPGFGGTQRLLQRCGVGMTRFLCLSGELLSAREAYDKGLVDRLVEVDRLDQVVDALAETIASKAPLAVQGAKRVVQRATETQLLAGLRHEVGCFLRLFETDDRREGMEAFTQKRTPEFHGR